MKRPLEGIRIIDLSAVIMAPFATQFLGDMGADIIKVEQPGGDPIRGMGPLRNNDMGAIFLAANRSKRSVVLDLKHPDGVAALKELMKGADALIYNMRPQAMERLGLSYEACTAVNPRLVYAGIYGYSQDGPYAAKPAYDDLIQGACAIPSLFPMIDGGKPRYVPTAIVDRSMSFWAIGQIVTALFHQLRTGEGQRVDITMFEVMAGFVLSDHMNGRTFEPPAGPAGYPRMLTRHRQPYRTSDGYVCVLIYTDRHWRRFYEAIGRADDFERDPRLHNIKNRTENIDALYRELGEIFATRTSAEWLELLERADIPAMPLHDLDSLIADPHLEAIGFFPVVDHPTEGRLRMTAFPTKWSRTQPAPTSLPPRTGQHSAEVLREIGYSDERIRDLARRGVTAIPETSSAEVEARA